MNVTIPETNVIPFLSDKEIDVLRRTILKQFTEDEQESFVRQCLRSLLDPFSKQIFATRRWVKDGQGNKKPQLTTVTSIMGLCAIAIRTGTYDGCVIQWSGKDGVWKDEWLSDEFPAAAKCTVYVKGRTHPEVGIARWEGYVGKAFDQSTKRWEVTDFWERMPDFMIGKCAKAQALRGAYPDQCSNIYISEELQGGLSEADDIADDEVKIATNRAKEEELLKKAKAEGVRIVENKAKTKPTPAEVAAPMPEPPLGANSLQQQPPPKGQGPEPTTPTPIVPEAEMQKMQQQPPPDAAPAEEPDDLEMGVTEAPAEVPPAWKDHVIRGLKNPKFFERKVGDLSIAELQAIEAQWLPKVREVWGQVNTLQREDAEAFEAALAHSKLGKTL
jgi:phage recombination protein Bet